jgi:V/A-type H+-transporting ATPase subunit G/H
MENTLKRLLNAETEAEQLVENAKTQREQLIQHALQKAHDAEQNFKQSIPELRAGALEKAKGRAEQGVAELRKRYAERQTSLRNLAEENHDKALDAAIRLVTQVGKGL